MDLINGFMNVLKLSNLLYCFIGCLLGTLVGVLPGLGPASSLAILFPITMYLDPTGSIIMLSGVYYGAMYGGSTTSILVNIPGEVASIPTCYDGFPMTQKGRAGEALWISVVGSFIAGTMGVVMISFIGPGLAKYALRFGPPEYFGLFTFSLLMLINLSGTSLSKGLLVGLSGFLVAASGTDPLSGARRLNFGIIALMRGIDIIPLVVGLFGIAEVFLSAEAGLIRIYEGKIGKMMPRGRELKKGLLSCVRGTALGLPLGLIPGMTHAMSSFLAYDLEKRISKYPEKFGTGVIEGVGAPESANNATAQTAFIPLMALGIPTHATTAIILAAFTIYGLRPGPQLFIQSGLFAWSVIASMYIGNVMLLILNLPLVGLWARISLIPYKYLGPIILLACIAGAYSPRNTMFDVWVALAFGGIGYIMRKKNWPTAPLVLGAILGPMFEVALRQSLSMGGPLIFFRRPIAITFFLLTIISTVLIVKYFRHIPSAVIQEIKAET